MSCRDPVKKIRHGRPIICCFRAVKGIKVTISHLRCDAAARPGDPPPLNPPDPASPHHPALSPIHLYHSLPAAYLSICPPNAAFDESTFSLCFSQSSICLSTLCLRSPHGRRCARMNLTHARAHPHALSCFSGDTRKPKCSLIPTVSDSKSLTSEKQTKLNPQY